MAEVNIAKQQKLSIEYLKSILDYAPDTGTFIWKKRIFHNPKAESWNKKYAGTVAGRKGTSGYWDICIQYVRYGAHRVAWYYVYGKWPKEHIDHINGNKLDNRIINLREATAFQNKQNSFRKVPNSTGHKGVYLRKICPHCPYTARITAGGMVHHLGYFASAKLAAKAYREAAKKYHKEFASFH